MLIAHVNNHAGTITIWHSWTDHHGGTHRVQVESWHHARQGCSNLAGPGYRVIGTLGNDYAVSPDHDRAHEGVRRAQTSHDPSCPGCDGTANTRDGAAPRAEPARTGHRDRPAVPGVANPDNEVTGHQRCDAPGGGRVINQHTTDIGDYCPWSDVAVSAGYPAGCCPARCKASAVTYADPTTTAIEDHHTSRTVGLDHTADDNPPRH